MVPDLSAMEVPEGKLEAAHKYSNSSIMQVSDEESDSTENERKLIHQTENLSISTEYGDTMGK